MEGSSAIGASSQQSAIQVEVMKKAQDVQAQQVLRVLESTAQDTQQAVAQKTGMGQNLDIQA